MPRPRPRSSRRSNGYAARGSSWHIASAPSCAPIASSSSTAGNWWRAGPTLNWSGAVACTPSSSPRRSHSGRRTPPRCWRHCPGNRRPPGPPPGRSPAGALGAHPARRGPGTGRAHAAAGQQAPVEPGQQIVDDELLIARLRHRHAVDVQVHKAPADAVEVSLELLPVAGSPEVLDHRPELAIAVVEDGHPLCQLRAGPFPGEQPLHAPPVLAILPAELALHRSVQNELGGHGVAPEGHHSQLVLDARLEKRQQAVGAEDGEASTRLRRCRATVCAHELDDGLTIEVEEGFGQLDSGGPTVSFDLP